MSSIDNRIVKMGFENAQFTKAAEATMSTLRKLSDSLKLTDGAKGLENVASKAKSVDMRSLASSVDEVASRFSAMDIIGVTALVNISNSAFNAGKNLLSALTIDPILTGFQEYETKMGSIQTILTNTAHAGTTMDDVTAALDDLNVYADKTIYNFAEMTRNIGTFTAAGVDLESATVAIKGIANLAAGSGSTSAQASTAMYQLSQALASGKVNLQDWNSVVNAGMGGKLFQDALKETGRLMGANIDEAQSFRDSISAKDGTGWLTSEILLETLKKFADDPSLLQAATQVKTFTALIDTMKESVQSGWGKSWEYIIGDKEAAAEFFTSISQGFESIAGPMADYRNTALQFWNESGGREAIINGLANAAKAVGKVLGPIYESFKKIIDPWNGERLVSMSQAFEKLTEKLIISDKASAAIGKTFEVFFSIIKFGLSLLKPFGTILGAIGTIASPIIDVFFRLVGVFSDWTLSVKDGIDSAGLMDKALNWISTSAEKVAGMLEKLFGNVDEYFAKGLAKGSEYIGKFNNSIGEMYDKTKVKIKEIVQFVKDWNEAFQPMEKAKDFLIGVFDAMKNGIQGFLDFAKSSIKTIQGFFTSIVDRIKDSDIQGIDFVNAGLFASLILVIKKVLPMIKNFFSGVGTFKDTAIGVLEDLRGCLESYQKNVKADIIQKIAIAIGILAASIWVLSKVDPDRLIPAVAAMGTLIGGLMGALWAFNKIDPKGLKDSSASIISLIGISIALNVLASAMVKLSRLQWDEIGRSIVALGAACLAVLALTKTLDGAKLTPSQGLALMLMAGSLSILAGALSLIGNLDAEKLKSSLKTMAAVMLGVTVFLNLTKSVGNSTQVATSLIPMATSMIILAGALAILGNMNIGALTQGAAVISGALTVFSIFAQSVKGAGLDMLGASAGILILSGALIALSGAFGILGNMNIGTLVQGVLTMAAALTAIGLSMKLMPKAGMMMASTSILILAVAMTAMAGALALLGNLDIWTIVNGVFALAGVIAVFAGLSAILAPGIPLMAGMALGLLALGAACGLVGGGLMILAAGITTFSGSIVAAGVGFTGAITAMCAAIPIFMAAVALGFVSFLSVLGYNGEAIKRSLTSLLRALLETLNNNIPLFVQTITTFLSELMNAIKILGPQLIDTLVTLLMSLLETLTTNLPLIADMVMGFLLELFLAVMKNLTEGTPQVAAAIVEWVIAIINAFGDNVVTVVNAVWDFVIKMINAFAETVETKMPEVRAAVKRVISAIAEEFGNCIGDMIGIGGDIIGGITKGIKGGITKVADAASEVAKGALNAAKKLLDINSPSREFAKIGRWIDEGFAGGLSRYAGLVTTEVDGIGTSAMDGMRNAVAGLSELVDGSMDSTPTIRPVMDLSEIQNGVSSMSSMLDKKYDVSATATMNAKQVSSGMARMRDSLSNETPSSNTTNNSTNVTNHFNITSSNPKEVATEVSKILQKQVERRDVVWA